MPKIVEFARHHESLEDSGFYTSTEAARIARVPRNLVYAWKREGIIVPRIVWTEGDHETVGYNFEALVYLRLLRMLRVERKPLEKAVKCLKSLHARFGPPGPAWADVRIFAQFGDIFAESKSDEWEVTESTRHGQKVATVLFGAEFEDLRSRADALLVPRQFRDVVQVDPTVRNGYPTIVGTVLETRLPYGLAESGVSRTKIREYYPILTTQQIGEAIRYERLLDAEAA